MIFPIEPPGSQLLTRLWEVQLTNGYISDADILSLAKVYNMSAIEVEGVVTFYHFFHRQYAGKYTIYLNNSMTAQIQGFDRIVEAFERETGARVGAVDRTGTFGLFLTPCIGLCDHEPSALINFFPITHLNTAKVRQVVQHLKAGRPLDAIVDQPSAHIRYTPAGKKSLFFNDHTTDEVFQVLRTSSSEAIIDIIRQSKLAGRGGAFYPTWMKWAAAAGQISTPKFIVCNADEGEPGTFKDRVLLQEVPDALIEGMTVAAYTVGASYGFIYLRGEYMWLKPSLEEKLNQFRLKGYLGKNCGGIKGFDFDIRVQMGAGAYVCGEETALLESMEGKRGEPRTKWFFPVERGYLQQPTVINNVETYCAAANILAAGLEKYHQYGVPDSPGTKLISVSGDCDLPGIYEIEWGMQLGELLALCKAHDPFWIQESGPSGNVLSMHDFGRPIAMFAHGENPHIRCGGAITIYNRHRDIISILMNYASFYKHESCGICTPCRAGNFIIERKLQRLQNGLANADDLKDLDQWSKLMRATSRCGLGKTATNSITQAIEKFDEYFQKHIDQDFNGLNLKFDLAAATKDYENYKPS